MSAKGTTQDCHTYGLTCLRAAVTTRTVEPKVEKQLRVHGVLTSHTDTSLKTRAAENLGSRLIKALQTALKTQPHAYPADDFYQ